MIDRAMRAFWLNGYDATAIGDLEQATGIKRISIYNVWGDKEGLFLAALDRYHGKAVEIYDETVAAGGLDEIAGLFDMMSAPAPRDAPAHAGCLMVNTILDVRRVSEPIRQRVLDYRAMLKSAFRSALVTAREHGDMTCDDDTLDRRADFLVGILWGALATIRVNADTTAARPIALETAKTIAAWRT
ncbi:TetR/AcrR family transcriptional regulator [Jannaschia sp. CCS1]|uniref:TetR/AcrR family transcriptional regulator n=1 Tax=Jannaschia sp. (strain CCS1) TaxID=290400 RepID=UPI0020C7929E|nr:TetR/AcrR family transcriptional regulator [Jannaschia sp. CCS1]